MSYKIISHYLLFYIAVLFFVGTGIWAVLEVFHEVEIENALDERGVATSAIILTCNAGSKSNPISFEYKALDKSGNTRNYVSENQGGGGTSSNCKKGKIISVRYLPEAPEIARHSQNINFSTNLIIAICSLAIAMAIVYKAIKEGIVPDD